jgi:hypothetical protein
MEFQKIIGVAKQLKINKCWKFALDLCHNTSFDTIKYFEEFDTMPYVNRWRKRSDNVCIQKYNI